MTIGTPAIPHKEVQKKTANNTTNCEMESALPAIRGSR